MENWEEMYRASDTLLNHLISTGYQCAGYQIECHYRMAVSSWQRGDTESAKKHLDQTLILKVKRDPVKEINGPLENYQEIIKEIDLLVQEIAEKDSR